RCASAILASFPYTTLFRSGGAIVALVASAIAALSPSIAIFVAARFLQGLGGGACVVLSRAMVPDLLSGREAAKTYSMLMAMLGEDRKSTRLNSSHVSISYA